MWHDSILVSKVRSLQPSQGDSLHHEDLDAEQVTWWQGIRIVDVPTAIRQTIESGVPTYLIRHALDRAGRTSRLVARDHDRLLQELEDRDAGR